ncbi:MAG: alpha/beta hydrolase [Acidobacteriota bacterium]
MDTNAQLERVEAPVIEPATQAFLDALAAQGGKPIYRLSISEARGVLEGVQSQPIDKLAVDEEDLNIPGGPSGQVSVRIVRPMGATGNLPVIMYFHGGGWILGSRNTHDRLVREIANGANAAVVFVDYTPSPEAKYPVAIEEAYAATKYIAENGASLNLDGSRLAVVGDSVGGNMAAAVTILAKQRGGPEIVHQVLFYPVTNANFDTGSYNRFENGPWLTKKAMEWFWDAYAPDIESREEITASPLRASLDDLAGLPPALIIVDENDPLRDEGEAYARKLIQAGVRVVVTRYIATIHDFVMLNPLAASPAARAAIDQANDTLKKAFKEEAGLRLAA